MGPALLCVVGNQALSVLSFKGCEPPPVLTETVWFKLCGHDWRVQHGVVSFFGFSWWNVADGLRKLAVVESADPFEGGKPHGFEVAPRSSSRSAPTIMSR
ncbi:hypothetical protein AMC78_CH03869 [Rhizobium phaseoli]|nr:hypothetical protein AMC78_CH03869 [Rhizobium phaseoli]